jgi:hypothetical protein
MQAEMRDLCRAVLEVDRLRKTAGPERKRQQNARKDSPFESSKRAMTVGVLFSLIVANSANRPRMASD